MRVLSVQCVLGDKGLGTRTYDVVCDLGCRVVSAEVTILDVDGLQLFKRGELDAAIGRDFAPHVCRLVEQVDDGKNVELPCAIAQG